jgi:hypothetical protein
MEHLKNLEYLNFELRENLSKTILCSEAGQFLDKQVAAQASSYCIA